MTVSAQRLSVISLIVADLNRARAFYEKGLGFSPARAMDEIVFYRMNGFVLSLLTPKIWAGEEIQGGRPGAAMLALNMPSKAEVDAHLGRAVKAGGKLQKKAHDVYWGGYSGYFSDPDGHYWEVAWNPHWQITEDGRTLIPEPAAR